MLPSTRRLEDGDLAALVAFEPNDLCFEPCAVQVRHVRPPASEAAPLGRCPKDALPRGRDLEDVAFADQFAPVETGLQRPRRSRAIVDRHAGAIPPVDPHLDHGAGTSTAPSHLDEIETDRVKLFPYNALQLVVHAWSQLPPGTARTKKCGGSPHISTRDTGSRAVRLNLEEPGVTVKQSRKAVTAQRSAISTPSCLPLSPARWE